MSWTDELLAGVAGYLQAGAVGTWRPDGAYLPADVRPILIAAVPSTPDVVIVLTPYGVSDDPSLSDSVQGLQVRTRGDADPRTVNDLADDVFDRLHGAQGVGLPGGLRLVSAYRQSHTPLGVDGNGRHERSDNYHLTAWRPSAHRL